MISGIISCVCVMINNLILYNLKGGICKYELIFLYVWYYNIFVLFVVLDFVINFVNVVFDFEFLM